MGIREDIDYQGEPFGMWTTDGVLAEDGHSVAVASRWIPVGASMFEKSYYVTARNAYAAEVKGFEGLLRAN